MSPIPGGSLRMLQLKWPVPCCQRVQDPRCISKQFIVYSAEARHKLLTTSHLRAVVPYIHCKHVSREAISMELLRVELAYFLEVSFEISLPLLKVALTQRGPDPSPSPGPHHGWHLECDLTAVRGRERCEYWGDEAYLMFDSRMSR